MRRGSAGPATAGRPARAPRPRVRGASLRAAVVARPRHAQLARQWGLLRALQARPEGVPWRDLARLSGTGPRTVFRDLHTLRGAGFPVERATVRGRPVWRYTGPAGAPGPEVRFSAPELAALALARQLMTALPGSPFDAAMRSAFSKIQAACDREGIRVLEAADRRLHAAGRIGRAYTDRSVWFATVLDALHRNRTLRLRYWTLERDRTTDREVDPWGLVLHEGAFYLVGWCHERRASRTFLVDRIRSAVMTARTFEPPKGFSAREHFRDAWGVIRDCALEEAAIRFTGAAAKRVREGRWHPSQRLEAADDGSMTLTVRVAGRDEIARWVLSWGGDAEVLRPAALRESVRREAERLARRHAGPAA